MTIDAAAIVPAGARFEPPFEPPFEPQFGPQFKPGTDGIGRIVIDRPTDTVNAIDPPLIAALADAIAAARAARPRGLVIASAKPDQFVGGADLAMLSSWPSAAEIATRSPVNDPGPVATAILSISESGVRVLASSRSIAGNSSSAWRRCACQVSSPRTAVPS